MELQKDFREMHDWWKFEQGAKSARSFTDGNITTQDIFKFFKKVTLALIGLLVTAFGIIQLLVNR